MDYADTGGITRREETVIIFCVATKVQLAMILFAIIVVRTVVLLAVRGQTDTPPHSSTNGNQETLFCYRNNFIKIFFVIPF